MSPLEKRPTMRRNEVKKGAPRGNGSRRGLRWAAAAALGLSALAGSTTASAQDRSFAVDRLFFAGAPDDAIGIWRPQMGEKTRFYGTLGVGFAYEPFRVENEIATDSLKGTVKLKLGTPLKEQLLLYGAAGVEIFDRFAFQVELPGSIYQHGNPTGNATIGTSIVEPGNATLMDLRLDARVILFRNEARSFKLGAEGGVWVPTGNSNHYGSDGSAAATLGLAVEFDLKKVFFPINAGFRFGQGGAVNDFKSGPELKYAAGAFIPIRDGRFRIGGEIFGSAPISSTGKTGPAANLPLEWMGEMRVGLDAKKRWHIGAGGGTRLTPGYSPDFRLMALAGFNFSVADTDPPAPNRRFKVERDKEKFIDTDGDKIPDDIDLCPNEPEDGKPPNPDDGCPALPDRDGDGIPDVNDKCPDEPEDFDGIQDADGCPEDDADHDGIPDAQDACPLEPGDPDPDPKKNGCPKFIRRIKGSTEIQILKQVQFQTGRADILKNSFPILDEVVRLLKVNPEITHLDIEGHTDNRGSDQMNEKLSDDRSKSVMKYLVEHGIAAGRLAAQGFGPKRPIADNNTDKGRQTNRRVEFHIRNQVGGVPVNEAPPDPKEAVPPPQ